MTVKKVRKPTFIVTYNNQDITSSLEGSVVDISYSDVFEEGSDEINITVENRHGKWQNEWYPQMGAKLKVLMGYQGEELMDCGDFDIDGIDFSMPPAVVKIKALATGITESQRTREGKAYNDKNLKQIAEEIAAKNGLEIVGDIEPVEIRRITQAHESDLGFLQRVANDYGYGFSVKGKQLVFVKRRDIKGKNIIQEIDLSMPGQVSSWSFSDKIKDIVENAKVSYFDPEKRETLTEETDKIETYETSGDQLRLNNRAENKEQAKLKAESAVEKQNEDKTTGSLSLPGSPKLVAGANVLLTGMGNLSGKWQISQSQHSIQRGSGYTTQITIRKIYE